LFLCARWTSTAEHSFHDRKEGHDIPAYWICWPTDVALVFGKKHV
jgi:hypothetical protein